MIRSDEHLVFVYGTLLREEPNHSLLASAQFVKEAHTKPAFDLHDLGAFPAMVSGGCTAIAGELCAVDDRTLRLLDTLEGHPNLFQRESIEIEGNRRVEAYLFPRRNAEQYPILKSGSWRIKSE